MIHAGELPGRTSDESLHQVFAAAAVILSISISAFLLPDLLWVGRPQANALVLCVPVIAAASLIVLVSRLGSARPQMLDWAVILFMGFLVLRNPGPLSLELAILGIGLFYLASFAAREKSTLMAIVTAVAGIMIATSMLGLAELLFFDDNLYSLYVLPVHERFHRVGSTFTHPVVFGAFIVSALPFCALLYAKARNRFEKRLGISAVILSLPALVLTFSKGSWIIVAFGAGILSFILLYRSSRRSLAVLCLLMVPAALIIGYAATVSALSDNLRVRQSVKSRVFSWQNTLPAIEDNFVVGTGLQTGALVLDESEVVRERNEKLQRQIPVDNFYLGLFLEEGVVGFFLFLSFLGMLLARGAREIMKERGRRTWVIAFLASLIGLSLNAMTFEIFAWWSIYVLFWVTAGLLRGVTGSASAFTES